MEALKQLLSQGSWRVVGIPIEANNMRFQRLGVSYLIFNYQWLQINT